MTNRKRFTTYQIFFYPIYIIPTTVENGPPYVVGLDVKDVVRVVRDAGETRCKSATKWISRYTPGCRQPADNGTLSRVPWWTLGCRWAGMA
tara:strand:+ start:179 stop:451 length:273 start_codon:yes stop_codon:yes gene_type:complete